MRSNLLRFPFRNDWHQSLKAWFMIAVLIGTVSALATPARTEYSTVDLLSEHGSLPAAGGKISLGLYIKPDSGWHAYWKNPGDAGKEPSVKWDLPEGFTTTDLAFPVPHVIPFEDLTTYGYDEPILLLTEVSIDTELEEGKNYVLKGLARWVVCDDQLCVPERAEVSLGLTVDDGAVNTQMREIFSNARTLQARPVEWPANFQIDDGVVHFQIQPDRPLDEVKDGYLFVQDRKLVRYDEQNTSFTRDRVVLTMNASPRSDNVETTQAIYAFRDEDDQPAAVLLNVVQGAPDESVAPVVGAVSNEGMFSITNPQTWFAALIAAFIGGIILNVMPCVFPVLSIKALSLVELSRVDRKKVRESGVLYTLGIVVTFLLIGAALLIVRAAGQAVGWGFQLQLPIVNVLLALLMVAVGLNFFGVFEVGTRFMGVGQSLGVKSERTTAFFTGLLAVVVATPCLAPFMAPAIGWAFTQTALVSIATLLFLGLGLAFPYLLLSFVPALSNALPKPGPWMNTVRQVLAFPMLLTAIWLFWVVGRQLGVTAMAVALIGALALCFTLWTYGRSALTSARVPWRIFAGLGLIACLTITFSVENYKNEVVNNQSGTDEKLGELAVEIFDPDIVLSYLADGQPTFIYFTADWCISCIANERAALSTDTVASAFTSRNIKVVKADWTSEDPVITEWLAKFERVGVPLYLYFPTGAKLEEAAILPQVLTPGIVVAAIDKADNRPS